MRKLIQENKKYAEAEKVIEEMIGIGAFKEAFYARGFLEKRRNNYSAAIDAYNRSIQYGRGGVAIHRELAQSYFYAGKLEKAKEHIRKAEHSDPHNRYVVDLQCTIAMKMHDMAEVERCLRLLDKIDSGAYAHHRRSTYLLANGDFIEALEEARLAVDIAFKPGFEILANLANCAIECGELDEAGLALRTLDQRFKGMRADTRVGLRCKLEVRRGDLATAEALWNGLREKEAPVHLGLRLSILKLRETLGVLSSDQAKERTEISAKLKAAHDLDFEMLGRWEDD